MSADGSALKENEKYLDSIQGKIDQFTNAYQTMWSNTLDSQVVKDIVAFGTEVVKVIDKIGGLESALIAVASIAMIKTKTGPIEFLTQIVDATTKAINKAKQMPQNIMSAVAGTKQLTAATLEQSVANGTLTTTEAIRQASTHQLTLSQAALTDAELGSLLTTRGLSEAEQQSIISKLGLQSTTNTLTLATLQQAIADGKLTTSEALHVATATRLIGAETSLTAARGMEILTTNGADAAEAKNIITKLGLDASTKKLTADTILQAVANGTLTTSEGALAMSMLTATGATNGLAASFKALWASLGPIGWAILGITAALTIGISIFNAVYKTTEELVEELDELKVELQDVQSEIKTVNSELETTRDRMAELLAKDKLSFVEQEELGRLQKENNELQRKLDLLAEEEKIKAKEASKTFLDTMESYEDKTYWRDGEMSGWERFWSDTSYAGSQEEYIKKLMDEYDTVLKVDSGELDRSVLVDEMSADWYSERLGEEIKALTEAADGIEYYVGDNLTDEQKEVNEWLDYIYNTQDKLAIMRGGKNAKTNAINRILDKDENATIKKSIDEYVEALKKGDTSAKGKIDSIIRNNKDLVADLQASGIQINDELNEATEHFTSFASDANYATIEGKVKEMDEATQRLSAAFRNLNSSDLDLLKQALTDKGWVDAEGNLMSDAIAEYFGGENGGISAETQTEIERLVQQIYDGKISVDNALKQFEYFGVESTLDIYVDEVQTNFKDVFVDLTEVDGLLDTFEELGEAIGSAANALKTFNQAQAEMAYSGHVSIETALQLMEYTDDYGSILQVVDGQLQLVDGAEEALINTRIEAIKTSAEASLADATNAYNKAHLATQEYQAALTTDMSASVVAKSWEKVLAAGAGLMAGIKSLLTEESWTDAYNRGYNETLSKITGYETEYNDAGLQTLVDAEAEAKAVMDAAQDRVELANTLSAETLDSIHSSDTASGGTSNKDDAEKQKSEDGWEKLLKKYENELALITNERDLIEAQIDQMEATGGQASSQYYKDLIRNSGEEKDLLIEKKQALIDYLKANKDNVDQDTWTEMNNEINETAVAIKECTTNLLEYYETLEDIDSHYFEQAMDDVSRLGEEIEFVQGLLEDEDVADENGDWTEAGITRLGLYVNEMERAAQSAEQYKQKISNVEASWNAYQRLLSAAGGDVSQISTADLNKLYDTYGVVITSQEEYKEKTDEYTDAMRDQIEAQNTARDGIIQLNEARIDAIKDGIEKEIEAYEDYIDVVKDALDAERDLYKFKQDISKQTKDIATLERRIASLSGSDNAADIAERRRLEAELYDAKEGLNDTYYDHAKDAQSVALDEEALAFSESREKYIEELELTLDNVEQLIEDSMLEVLFNADVVYNQLAGEGGIADTYGITLSNELTEPWKKASEQAKQWKTDVGVYVDECKPFVVALSNEIKNKLGKDGAWRDATKAAQDYADFINGEDLRTHMNSSIGKLCTSIQSIIDKWKGVKTAADNAYDAQYRANNVGGKPQNSGGGGVEDTGAKKYPNGAPISKMHYVEATLPSNEYSHLKGIGKDSTNKEKAKDKAMASLSTAFHDYHHKKGKSDEQIYNLWYKNWASKINYKFDYYAKGTTGTSHDQWAITDEIGDELVLIPGKDGNLQYMRKGTGVVPADLTANLMEWGKINPNMANMSSIGTNLNMVSNAINKPELNLSFEALVKAERIDKDTLPEVKKFVQQEVNNLVKQMNYALKGVGSR